MTRSVNVQSRTWELDRPFRSAYGTLSTVDTVLVAIREDGVAGRGECRPFHPYGVTTESAVADIQSVIPVLEAGLDREALQELLPPGAARNAIDCALWDLEAKLSGSPAWKLAGLPEPRPISAIRMVPAVDPGEAGEIAAEMARSAQANPEPPWFKVKLPRDRDIERIAAIRDNAPEARILVDANCSWSRDEYERLTPVLADLNVAMIEQPFPVEADEILRDLPRPIPVCADESSRDLRTLERLCGLYDVVSIKLEKTGGFTEAIRMREHARADGFGVMVSCMISTPLALAPAVCLAIDVDHADLGGQPSLGLDQAPGFAFEAGYLRPPPPELWG